MFTSHCKMAAGGSPFDDLNRLFSNLDFDGRKDDKKKESSNGGNGRGNGSDDDDLSLGAKIVVGLTVGAGVGLAVGAGVAALSHLFGGSGSDDKSDSRKMPSRGIRYDEGDDFDDSSRPSGYNRAESFSNQGPLPGQGSRRYGYFRCNNCRHIWESAYSFSKGDGTKSVSYFQHKLAYLSCKAYLV